MPSDKGPEGGCSAPKGPGLDGGAAGGERGEAGQGQGNTESGYLRPARTSPGKSGVLLEDSVYGGGLTMF